MRAWSVRPSADGGAAGVAAVAAALVGAGVVAASEGVTTGAADGGAGVADGAAPAPHPARSEPTSTAIARLVSASRITRVFMSSPRLTVAASVSRDLESARFRPTPRVRVSRSPGQLPSTISPTWMNRGYSPIVVNRYSRPA